MNLSKIKELDLVNGKTKFYKKEVLNLYYRALVNSNSWELGLGFFSLSSFKLLAYPLSKFIINNNGKIRVYCNERFSERDYEIITEKNNSLIEKSRIIKDVLELCAALSGDDSSLFANCIIYLIQNNLLDIKVLISNTSSKGIAHHKNSIFKDDKGNVVVLSGSANASEQALLFNREDTNAFCSFWNETSPTKTIESTINEFNNTFTKGDDEWKILSLDSTELKNRIEELGFRQVDKEAIKEISNSYGNGNQLPFSEEIRNEIENEIKNQKLGFKQGITSILKKINTVEKFNFPYDKLREYQKKAVQKWMDNDFQGIFAMATGTGKTYAAFGTIHKILAIKNHIVVITCPFQHLIDQWGAQIKEFGITPILVYSNTGWKKKLPRALRNFVKNDSQLIIVATNQSILPGNDFSKLMNDYWVYAYFISDEAHTVGSGYLRSCLPQNATARLGLSATIDRYFDEIGTNFLKEYFGKIVYELPLKEAIGKYLVEYYYYAIPVELEESKFQDYINLSASIKKLSVFDDAEAEEKVKTLLMKRARLANNCRNKLKWIKEDLELSDDFKHTLFYVGDEIFEETVSILSHHKGIVASRFYGKTKSKERQDILDQFSKGIIKCLVAMKCLDEGVDVPATETAYFLASSGNPKEFIQRRGRVLRMSPESGKKYATIYDLISVPPSNVKRGHEHFETSRTLLKSEFKRIQEFASLSKNRFNSLKKLKNIISDFNLYEQISET